MNVLVFEDYTSSLGIPAGVELDARDGKIELWNAARPFPAHETYIGEFMHGVFYGVIYPGQEYADEYRESAIQLDAYRIEFVSKATVMDYGRKVAEDYGVDPSEWDYEDILTSYIGMRCRQDRDAQ